MSDVQQIKGVITHVLPVQSGTSQSGKQWSKLDFVIQTDGKYPKSIAFTLFGDKVKLLDGVGTGSTVDVSYNLESREHEGRWFTNVNAWKVVVEAPGQPVSYATAPNEMPSAPMNNDAPPADDIPF